MIKKKFHRVEKDLVTWVISLIAHEPTDSSLQRLLRKLLLTKQYMKKLRELKEGGQYDETGKKIAYLFRRLFTC